MALKEDGMYFVLCPKQGMYSRIIFAKQSQGLIAAPPPPPPNYYVCVGGVSFKRLKTLQKRRARL